MLYSHTQSGRTFTADAAGSFGAASADGYWDSGEVGTIWPAETLSDGTALWTVVSA